MREGQRTPQPYNRKGVKQTMSLSDRYSGHRNPDGLDDLVGVTDIAHNLGVRSTAVTNWVSRHEDFPRPAIIAGKDRRQTGLWRMSEVEQWHRGRQR